MYALKVTTRGECEIVMTRMFDAPRRLVFDAWTKPDLLKRWFGGPRGWSLVECDIDLRPGGRYRFLARHLDGRDMGWGGTYKEVVAPERVVFTEAFDQKWYAGESLITQQITEEGANKTLVTSVLQYDSKATRDAVLKSPMESGVAEGHRRLDEFLAAELAKD